MAYQTKWTHNPVILDKEQQKKLDFEIEQISDDLDHASDLIFHTVFLTESTDGAIVMIDGREGYPDTLFLTYYETPEWVTLNDID